MVQIFDKYGVLKRPSILGVASWGNIVGTITDQVDLTSYLSTNYYPLLSNPAGYLTSAALSGYVPTSRTLTINGVTYDLSTDRSWTVSASAAWGSITGTLTAQTDLTTYLSTNYYPLSSNPAGYLTAIPTIQQVLNAGDTATDKKLEIISTTSTAILSLNKYGDNTVRIVDATNDTQSAMGAGAFAIVNNAGTNLTSYELNRIINNSDTYSFPNKSGVPQTFAMLSDIPTIGTWGALNYPTWTTGTPFVKMTAAGTFALDTNTYLTSVGTGTPNELTYWSGANTLGSLSTATYPSLTELSYVKGVTSAIQTQLNAKQNSLGYTPYRYVDATRATYLASVIGITEYIVSQTTIVGGTFATTDVMKMITRFSKPSGLNSVTLRVRINTTNTLVGATQIALLTLAAANTTSLLTRTFNLSGGNLYGYNFASSLALDLIATNTVGSSTAYNTANDLYVFFTVQIANVADSITFELANITN
jgi:hypothetical protein